jgi:choline dehydrogenase-like flavoprotein
LSFFFVEKYHGSGGPLYVGKLKDRSILADYFIKAAKEMGFQERDPNSKQSQGFSQLDATLKNGARWGTFEAFLQPILHRRNLVIYRYARVIKIHLDRRKNCYGVTYIRHGMKKFVRARKEVIIRLELYSIVFQKYLYGIHMYEIDIHSAGAVDSARLLMLSGIGIKSHLNQVGVRPMQLS